METDDAYKSIDRKVARVLKECANISLDIDSNEEVIDMCKAWSNAQKDAERNGAILGTIETLRDLNFVEEEIKEKIIAK